MNRLLFVPLLVFAAFDASAGSDKSSAKYDDLGENYQSVWKKHRSYIFFSYERQSLQGGSNSMDSDMSLAFIGGRTFHLHRKPLAGVMKFGLDWDMADLTYASYPDLPSSFSASTSKLQDLSIIKVEAGMGVGPSVTINPVSHLKANVFFHVVPSFSLMYQSSAADCQYSTFFKTGLSVSYKVISLGVSYRWNGETDYGGVAMGRINEVYDETGAFLDPFESIGAKIKTSGLRFSIGLRF